MNDGEGRRKRVTYLATGTIQNAPCVPCGRDTMHKNGRCLNCEVQPAQVVDPAPRRGKVSNRTPVKS